MTTATSETVAEEYSRLVGEQHELSAAARRNDGLPEEGKQRFREVAQRLREILAIPPDGYTLPAEAHGWVALAQWTSLGYVGDPFVTVQVGRLVTEADGYLGLGDRWKYNLTWHSRGCAPGKVRLFGSGIAVTPANPGGGYAPSVKAIRAVIEQHPAPGA